MKPTPSASPTRRSARLSGTAAPSDLPIAHIVHFVLDRSGSISSMGNAPAEQICASIQELKDESEQSGVITRVSITTFDDRSSTFMDNVELNNNPNLPLYSQYREALAPRGMTRLYDTMAEEISNLEKARDAFVEGLPAAVKQLNPKVICSIMVLTDGADNTSKMHTQASVAERLGAARANGVNAIFLAANIDASTEGAALGFAKAATVQMDSSYAGASQCMRTVSKGLRRASSGDTGTDYSAGSIKLSDTAPTMPPMPQLRRY